MCCETTYFVCHSLSYNDFSICEQNEAAQFTSWPVGVHSSGDNRNTFQKSVAKVLQPDSCFIG